MDAPVPFKLVDGGNLAISFAESAVGNGGLLAFSWLGYSTHTTTHPSLYRYLPTDLKLDRQHPSSPQGGVFLLYTTQVIFNEIFYWHVLCSLQDDCIAPPGAKLWLTDLRIQQGNWSGIHLLDQSILGVTLFDYEQKHNESIHRAALNEKAVLTRRGDKTVYEITACKRHQTFSSITSLHVCHQYVQSVVMKMKDGHWKKEGKIKKMKTGGDKN